MMSGNKQKLNCGRLNKIFILPLLIILFISGCIGPYPCITGSGNIVSQEFTLDEFHSVGFGGFGNLYITQGAQSLRIEAEDNVIEQFNVNVENGKLNIYPERCFRNIEPVNIYASMEEVRELSLSGSGNIIGQSEINADELRLRVSGSGSINITLNSEELNTNIAGSGKADLKGTSGVHNSIISGSGSINAFDLLTNRTDITITGSGNAEVDASRELDVTITGSGNVFYKGNASVSQSVSGSGKIVKR